MRGDEDLALLLYTSGTTGRPRGAMLSHRALLANLDQLVTIDPPVVAADDRVLLVLPLFHVYGLNSGLGMVAKAGSTGVLARRFDPVETLAQVRDQQVSCIVGAPPMYLAWSMLPDLGESLSTVRLALSGAAPLPARCCLRCSRQPASSLRGLRADRDRARSHHDAVQSGARSPAASAARCPGVTVKILPRSTTPRTRSTSRTPAS